ncbi:MAG: hypothetical protein ACR65R_07125 [Methylomicrobium sp.]
MTDETKIVDASNVIDDEKFFLRYVDPNLRENLKIHTNPLRRGRISIGEYKDLALWELSVLAAYRHEYFDIKPLAKIVRDGVEISQGMRNFIADVMLGKVIRPNGKRSSTGYRDIRIYNEIMELINDGVSLTSNAERSGAAAIIGEKFGISEDAALKAYQKTRKIRKDRDRSITRR